MGCDRCDQLTARLALLEKDRDAARNAAAAEAADANRHWCAKCDAENERDALRAALAEATRGIEWRTREMDVLGDFVEACDAVGSAIAKAEGKPYDRATCWGEPTLYLAERVRKLLGEED